MATKTLVFVVAVAIVVIIVAIVSNTDWSQHPFIAGHPKITTKTIAGKPTEKSTEEPQGKALWDWLQLLIIPALLSIGAAWFTARQNHDREITVDDQQENELQGYFERITDLLLNHHLRTSKG